MPIAIRVIKKTKRGKSPFTRRLSFFRKAIKFLLKENIKSAIFPAASLITLFSLAGILYSATPNPGHPWSQIGEGLWAATGTTALRTFTFPDATATVLTTNSAVTVAQGGTGTTSTSTALNVLTGLSVKGDLLVHNGSIHGRLPVGSNNTVLMADSAQSLGMKWATATGTPAGVNGQLQFNDSGQMGATSSLRFDKANQTFGVNGEIDLLTQTDPSAPAADTLRLYAKKISGRSMLKAKSPYGIDYAYQPSFFQNSIFIISPGSGTAYSTIGNTLTSVGTVSHVVSETLGYMANQVTAAAASSTAGTGSATTPYFMGTQVGSNGFFLQARMAFPDATTTGLLAFIGFTAQTMAVSVASSAPLGPYLGFQYSTQRGDTGWKFISRGTGAQTVSSTLLPFAVGAIMDFFIYCPPYPNNGTVYYRVDNVSSSTTAEGNTSSTLPAGGTQMRAGFQINNITANARNVRLGRFYVETDR
jgi:hypothetical protein